MVKTLNAKNIVEIGTYTGLSALAFKEGCKDVFLTKYDIIKWDELNVSSHLENKDFNKSFKNLIGDLSEDNFFENNLDILNNADIIFMDAPKDNLFEYKMAKQFKKLKNKNKKS